jgi:hypothetical protein
METLSMKNLQFFNHFRFYYTLTLTAERIRLSFWKHYEFLESGRILSKTGNGTT